MKLVININTKKAGKVTATTAKQAQQQVNEALRVLRSHWPIGPTTVTAVLCNDDGTACAVLSID